MPRNALIQVRRDTAAEWSDVNPTLASGEMGFETDTGKFKIGTGSTALLTQEEYDAWVEFSRGIWDDSSAMEKETE